MGIAILAILGAIQNNKFVVTMIRFNYDNSSDKFSWQTMMYEGESIHLIKSGCDMKCFQINLRG